MSATTPTVDQPAAAPVTDAPDRGRSIPRAGWMVIAAKEFGDHLLSSRFIVLLLVLGLAVGIPVLPRDRADPRTSRRR